MGASAPTRRKENADDAKPFGVDVAWGSHIAAAIQSCTVVEWPFSHVVVDNIFPAAMYRRMLEEMPPDREFSPFVFGRKRVDILPQPRGFWKGLYSGVLATSVAPALVARLRRHLRPDVDVGNLELRECTLVRDSLGYGIRPHSDDPALKALSIICYLPRTHAMQRFGTSIVAPRRGKTIDVHPYRWHSWRNFEVVRQVDFLPNRLFAFPVTADSFHAVKRVWKPLPRDSVQLFMA